MAQRDELVTFTYKIVGDDKVAATAVTMAKTGTAAQGASEEVVKLSDSLKTAASSATLIEKALSQKAGLADLTKQLADAQAGLDKLRSEFDQTDTSSKKVTKAFADAEKAVASLTQQQTAASVALQKTEGALQKNSVDTSNLAAAFTKVRAEGNAAATALAEIGQKAAASAAGTGQLASSTKDAGDKAKTAGGLFAELRDNLGKIVSVAAAVKLALAGIQVGKDQFSGAADVEQQLSRVQAIAKTTADSFSQLSEQIEKSARAANVTTAQAAETAAELAAQGETADEIFKTLTPTLLLARDANLELAQAAAIVDDVLDLFGKNAGDAADVVDKLVAASKGSKEGLGGMADAIRALAPDARQLGIDFDHLTGLLGLLTQNGIDASKATKGLRTVFQDLQNPTSDFSKALGEIGDHSSDFTQAITAIQNGGKKGQDALLTLSGAARSLVLFLSQQAPGAVDTFVTSLQNVQGAAEKTRAAIDDNLKGAAASFANSFDRLGEGLAKTSLGPLRDELTKLSDQLIKFAESPAFSDLQKSLTELFAAGVDAFDNFIQKVDWAGFIDSIKSGIKDAAATIGEFKDDISGVAEAINTIGATIGVFTRSIAVAFDTVKVGVSATVAAIAGLAAKMSQIQDTFAGGFESDATRGLLAVRDAALAAANDGADALIKNGDKLLVNLQAMAGVSEKTATSVDKLTTSAKQTADSVQGASDAAASSATGFDAVSGAVDNVANSLGILPEIYNATATAAESAASAANDHANAIIAARQAVDTTREALDKLITSGNASADAMNAAGIAYKQAQASLDQLTGKTQTAVDSQRALAQAFATLHLSSQQDLLKAADNARQALDSIHQSFLSGGASIEDQRRAFQAWAQTVRSSVADSEQSVKDQAQAQIDAEASALGFTDAATKAGAAGAQAGSDTAAGFDKAASSIGNASTAADNLATNAAAAATGVSALGAGASAASSSVTSLATGVQGIVLLSADQLRLLKEIGQEFLDGAISGEEYARRVVVAMGGVDEELQRQQENLRNFQNALDDLNAQIAGETGDTKSQEDIRHEQKLRDLKDEFQVQGTLTASQYQQLLRAENELHDLKLKNLKKEQQQQQQGSQAPANTNTNAGGSNAGSGTNGGGGAAPAAPNTTNIVQAVLLSGDQRALDTFTRQIKKNLDDINGRSR